MSGKINLFDDNSDEEEGNEALTINQNYAEKYEKWREAEVKRQLEDRHGKSVDDVTSSSSDDEEDPEVLKKVLSKDFFEVISSLKTKDPKIYDSQVRFFQNENAGDGEGSQSKVPAKKDVKEKPVYLRDYERKLITERGGELSDGDSDIEIENERAQSPSYVEEQRQLKESFKKALYDQDSDDEGGLLHKKAKTKEEKEKEEEDYIEWLKGQRESLADKETEKSLKPLQQLWNDPKLEDGEKFLRDYILNKRYLENDDAPIDTVNVSDDDYQDEYMNTFERQYNFRFEEPDREFLKRFPRTMEQSLRKKDTRRKERRDAVKQRKEEEKQKKREELKLLKSLKRKEIMEKIEKIKSITGNDDLGLNPEELEEDFDPEAHDRKMRELFDDNYYGDADNAEDEDGLNLPPLEEELLDDDNVNWDDWDGTDRNTYSGQGEGNADGNAVLDADIEPHCEDAEFNMDCDYDPTVEHARREEKSVGRQSAREKRKLKRQSRFGRLVRKEKPVFDPNDKTFQQYVDEYYGMDYEDLIGDIPCRFKYKTVIPNSFGLTIEEILAADDKELNQWASIKKATTIRPDAVEQYEAKVYAQKAQNEELKRKILPSLFKNETEYQVGEESRKKKKKNKGKKESDSDAFLSYNEEQNVQTQTKKRKTNNDETGNDAGSNEEAGTEDHEWQESRKKKKSKGKKESSADIVSINNDELNVQTSKKKTKMDAEIAVNESVSHQDAATNNQGEETRKTKKNKGNKESSADIVSSNSHEPIKKKRKIDNEVFTSESVIHQDTMVPGESSKKKNKKNKESTSAPHENSSSIGVGEHQNINQNHHGLAKKTKSFDQKVGLKKNFQKWNKTGQDGKRKPHQGAAQNQKPNHAAKKGRKSLNQQDGSPKNLKKWNSKGQNGKGKQQETELSDERLKAYGIQPKRFRNKLKYGPKQ